VGKRCRRHVNKEIMGARSSSELKELLGRKPEV